MSVDRCDGCCKAVDTDFDDEFYVPVPAGDGRAFDITIKGLCPRCRERFYNEHPELEDL